MYKDFIKRFIDVTLSMIGFILIMPVFLFLWLLLAIANKGTGAFFTQNRPGRGEKIFKVIKFKTMNDYRDREGNLLSDAQRLTKIGKIVRYTSLDEIPQLLNVIKGDMSLIGPRPLLMQYLPLYNDRQRRRHEVRPGITGWAQVNGRNLMKLSKKFEYDVWYVENISFLLDLKILYLTVLNVIRSKDVGQGAENMQEVDDLNFMSRLNTTNNESN